MNESKRSGNMEATRHCRAEEQPALRKVSPFCSRCLPLKECALFNSPDFQAIAKTRIYGRDCTIVRQGDRVNNLFVLRSGWLQLTHVIRSGKSIVELMGPGSVLGLACTMSGRPYSYTAIALEECEVEQVESRRFLDFLQVHPPAAVELLKQVSSHLERILAHFYKMAGRVPSHERIMDVLKEISASHGVPEADGTRINLPLSIQLLADMIGCSRQWISKMLRDLEMRGELKRNRSWITILKQRSKLTIAK